MGRRDRFGGSDDRRPARERESEQPKESKRSEETADTGTGSGTVSDADPVRRARPSDDDQRDDLSDPAGVRPSFERIGRKPEEAAEDVTARTEATERAAKAAAGEQLDEKAAQAADVLGTDGDAASRAGWGEDTRDLAEAGADRIEAVVDDPIGLVNDLNRSLKEGLVEFGENTAEYVGGELNELDDRREQGTETALRETEQLLERGVVVDTSMGVTTAVGVEPGDLSGAADASTEAVGTAHVDADGASAAVVGGAEGDFGAGAGGAEIEADVDGNVDLTADLSADGATTGGRADAGASFDFGVGSVTVDASTDVGFSAGPDGGSVSMDVSYGAGASIDDDAVQDAQQGLQDAGDAAQDAFDDALEQAQQTAEGALEDGQEHADEIVESIEEMIPSDDGDDGSDDTYGDDDGDGYGLDDAADDVGDAFDFLTGG